MVDEELDELEAQVVDVVVVVVELLELDDEELLLVLEEGEELAELLGELELVEVLPDNCADVVVDELEVVLEAWEPESATCAPIPPIARRTITMSTEIVRETAGDFDKK